MFGLHALSPHEVAQAAHKVLTVLLVFLAMGLFTALRISILHTFTNEGGATTTSWLTSRLKMWAVLMFVAGLVIVIIVAEDIGDLAYTFPHWGILAAAVVLFPLWMACRLAFLTAENLSDQTFDHRHRISLDTKWRRQDQGKRRLLKELYVWIFALIAAVIWLIDLSGVSPLELGR